MYWKTTYLAACEPVLNSISGPNLWKYIDLSPMKPPNYGKSPSKPKKARKKGPFEDESSRSIVNPEKPHKLSKVGTRMSCTICEK